MKNYNIILILIIIVISCTVISANFKVVLQNKYFLDIDSLNRAYIESEISNNYKLLGTLEKVAYMQGLGDWYLFLYYDNGIEEQALFSDSNKKVQPLRDYIIKNGYNNSSISAIKIYISIGAILISIIYLIIYLIIQSKMKNKQSSVNK